MLTKPQVLEIIATGEDAAQLALSTHGLLQEAGLDHLARQALVQHSLVERVVQTLGRAAGVVVDCG